MARRDSCRDDLSQRSRARRGQAGRRATRPRDDVQPTPLESWLVALEEGFSDRLLVSDEAVADAWGRLTATDPLPPVDGLMAATPLVHGLVIVTRDTRPFERIGVPWLDPWA